MKPILIQTLVLDKREPVEITWIDACSDREGWFALDAPQAQPSRQQIFTIGYLLRRTKQYIQVAQSVGSELDLTAERITIPMGCVQRVRRL